MSRLSWIALSFAAAAVSLAHAARPAELPECAAPVKACEAAGYEPGEHSKNGKGLWVDCIHKRAMDKPVPGVDITPADAQKCAAAAKTARHH